MEDFVARLAPFYHGHLSQKWGIFSHIIGISQRLCQFVAAIVP